MDTNSKIFGLPLSYLTPVDVKARAYNKSFLSDCPLVFILPGNLDPDNSIVDTTINTINNVIPFGFSPFRLDQRKIKFKQAYSEYCAYANTLQQYVYSQLMGLDYGTDIKVPNNYEFLTGDSFPVGSETYGKDMLDEVNNLIVNTYIKKKIETVNTNEEALKGATKFAEERAAQQEKNDKRVNDTINKYTGNTQPSSDIMKKKSLARKFNQSSFTHGLIYYMEAQSQITESVSNSYGESELASEMKSITSQAQARKYNKDFKTFGGVFDTMGKIKDFFSGVINRNDISDMAAMVQGANIILPKVWQESSYSKSIDISFKFTSPYGDNASIFEYVLNPLITLMCLTLPRQLKYNAQTAPFVVMVDSPGNFFCELGIIESMTFTKGGDSQCWNAYGLPLTVSVNLQISDLTPGIMISDSWVEMEKSGSMAAWCANLCGLSLERSVGSFSWRFSTKLRMLRTNVSNFLNMDNYIFKVKKEYDIVTNHLLNRNLSSFVEKNW